MIASVKSCHLKSLWDKDIPSSTVKIVFSNSTPCSAHPFNECPIDVSIDKFKSLFNSIKMFLRLFGIFTPGFTPKASQEAKPLVC